MWSEFSLPAWLASIIAPGLLAGALILIAALWLDRWLGEPRRFHPLVGFGNLAQRIEAFCRRLSFLSEKQQGVLGWMLVSGARSVGHGVSGRVGRAVQPAALVCPQCRDPVSHYRHCSLIQHVENIYLPLKAGEIDQARKQVSLIVSRNTEKMQEKEIVSTIESVLENGNDAVFAPMIWFFAVGRARRGVAASGQHA